MMLRSGRNDKNTGYALIVVLFFITVGFAAVAVSHHVCTMMVHDHDRYLTTLENLRNVKIALAGENAFFDNYGEPDNTAEGINLLLERDNTSTAWHYTSNRIWCGYRGERYLTATMYDSVSPYDPLYLDGWGNEVQVTFDNDAVEILSYGSDNLSDSAGGSTDGYAKDISENFYYKRPVRMRVSFIDASGLYSAGSTSVAVCIVYPEKGSELVTTPQTATVSFSSEAAFVFSEKIPVGTRKAIFYIPDTTGIIVAETNVSISGHPVGVGEGTSSDTVSCEISLKVML